MIGVWHLIWIIPVSASVDMMLTAMLVGRRDENPEEIVEADSVYDPVYQDDDRRHSGLLEEDD